MFVFVCVCQDLLFSNSLEDEDTAKALVYFKDLYGRC